MRRSLEVGQSFLIGRTTEPFAAQWDGKISSQHAEATWDGRVLHIRRLATATNPIFFEGRVTESVNVAPRQYFVIGRTEFHVVPHEVDATIDSPRPQAEVTLAPARLQAAPFRVAGERIDAISKLASEVSAAASDEQLAARTLEVVLKGIPHAKGAAIFEKRGDPIITAAIHLRDDHVPMTPSAKLILQTLKSRECTIHVWEKGDEPSEGITVDPHAEWALGAPIGALPAVLYVSGVSPRLIGQATEVATLQDDLKFTLLAAATYGNLLNARELQKRQTSFAQFFSPSLQQLLEQDDWESLLQPRIADVTVLFCDLRGFSRRAELQRDRLLQLLDEVSDAIGMMTAAILDHGGVIGDFHGDAVMGFWGWPVAKEDDASAACRAALQILDAADRDGRYRVGVGLASGSAVAGKIGSQDQVKVTTLGPPVNLASRLESLSKQFASPVLVDEATAIAAGCEDLRFERLLKVQPAGMEQATAVYALSSSESPAKFAEMEPALEAFDRGDWRSSLEAFRRTGAGHPLRQLIEAYIAQVGESPDEGWNGALPIDRK
ncbi:adenylate/guanylate cyclase domain-containing protein [Blastopirellula sp. J2-11]|uniref:adenylate/guanylate cyclase domain-containing protein n=1 Tax=Blastopirellula sp. J2-11 TaxID=2943192 RepID=UPI0021C82267|nr:adenylate/guanylate cyclase domain-containing protein [Blastopirellula sp. J2-11]UUO06575.1 adenylate/guanylate cyclase domain-containing protein [Blastopirellula sp. J2-11]